LPRIVKALNEMKIQALRREMRDGEGGKCKNEKEWKRECKLRKVAMAHFDHKHTRVTPSQQ